MAAPKHHFRWTTKLFMDPVKSSKQNIGDSTGPPRYRNDKHFTLHRNVLVAILFKFKIQLSGAESLRELLLLWLAARARRVLSRPELKARFRAESRKCFSTLACQRNISFLLSFLSFSVSLCKKPIIPTVSSRAIDCRTCPSVIFPLFFFVTARLLRIIIPSWCHAPR